MAILRSGQRILTIPGFGVTTSRRAVISAAADWWPVAGKTCLAAYQPKGAATYAASKINLANPGTYDAGDGTAYPTFDTATGWTFNGSTQYLTTGITDTATYTCIVRISDASGSDAYAFGTFDAVSKVFGVAGDSGSKFLWFYGINNFFTKSPAETAGVFGMTRTTAYRNGAVDGSLAVGTASLTGVAMFLGALNTSGNATNFYAGKMQAMVIYSDALTDGEVATVSAAMALL